MLMNVTSFSILSLPMSLNWMSSNFSMKIGTVSFLTFVGCLFLIFNMQCLRLVNFVSVKKRNRKSISIMYEFLFYLGAR